MIRVGINSQGALELCHASPRGQPLLASCVPCMRQEAGIFSLLSLQLTSCVAGADTWAVRAARAAGIPAPPHQVRFCHHPMNFYRCARSALFQSSAAASSHFAACHCAATPSCLSLHVGIYISVSLLPLPADAATSFASAALGWQSRILFPERDAPCSFLQTRCAKIRMGCRLGLDRHAHCRLTTHRKPLPFVADAHL